MKHLEMIEGAEAAVWAGAAISARSLGALPETEGQKGGEEGGEKEVILALVIRRWAGI